MRISFFAAFAVALWLLSAPDTHAQISFGPTVGLNLATVQYKLTDSAKVLGFRNERVVMRLGASVGVLVNARYGKIAIQSSLKYSTQGYSYDRTDEGIRTLRIMGDIGLQEYYFKSQASLRFSYLNIPITLVYTTDATQGWQVLVGPYIGLRVGGKYEYNYQMKTGIVYSRWIDLEPMDVVLDNAGTIKAGSKVSKDDILADYSEENSGLDYLFGTRKAIDIGCNVGVGYAVDNWQAQAVYQIGFSNATPHYGLRGYDIASKTERNRVLSLNVAYLFGARP